jgi:hypothetical protein
MVSLLVVVRAAEGKGNDEPCVLAEYFGIFGDLHGEFARWRQHKRARLSLTPGLRLGLQQALKCGDQERGRLTGAGLRLTGDIVLFEGNREGAGLNRRTELEARVTDTRVNRLL